MQENIGILSKLLLKSGVNPMYYANKLMALMNKHVSTRPPLKNQITNLICMHAISI